MRKYRIPLSLLTFIICLSALGASQQEEVHGMVILGKADTLTYSLRSQKAASSIPSTLAPAIQGSKLILDYQFGWMSCSESDQSVLAKGDTIIIQKTISGGCVKTIRAYAIHAEMEGLPGRDFLLQVRLADAREDRHPPSHKILSSMLVKPNASDSNPGGDSLSAAIMGLFPNEKEEKASGKRRPKPVKRSSDEPYYEQTTFRSTAAIMRSLRPYSPILNREYLVHFSGKPRPKGTITTRIFIHPEGRVIRAKIIGDAIKDSAFAAKTLAFFMELKFEPIKRNVVDSVSIPFGFPP